MAGGASSLVPLSAAQRKRVEENVGLVAVHLRRNVRNLHTPRRDREWEDLFQEGCLGLMRAAVSYVEDCGIPFAAYALPRIHNAVSRALQRRFSVVYVPPKRSAPPAADQDRVAGDAPNRVEQFRPKTVSLSDEWQGAAPSPPEQQVNPDCETIGHRLRQKYERAVRAACDDASRRTSTRGDRAHLVEQLLNERFLIPNEETKRPLRQIARDTKSSYARVAQCDKQIGELTRAALEADPEFRTLRHVAKNSPDGVHEPIDERVEHELADAAAGEFMRWLNEASERDRGRLLRAVFKVSGDDLDAMIRQRIMRLSSDERENLLDESRATTKRKSSPTDLSDRMA